MRSTSLSSDLWLYFLIWQQAFCLLISSLGLGGFSWPIWMVPIGMQKERGRQEPGGLSGIGMQPAFPDGRDGGRGP